MAASGQEIWVCRSPHPATPLFSAGASTFRIARPSHGFPSPPSAMPAAPRPDRCRSSPPSSLPADLRTILAAPAHSKATRVVPEVRVSRGREFQEETIPGDVDGDGHVGFTDLLYILGNWGPCPDPPFNCHGDLDHDGSIGFTDLLKVLHEWGSCLSCFIRRGAGALRESELLADASNPHEPVATGH